MRRLHPALKIPLVAVGAAVVGFPFLSVEGDGSAAGVTIRTLWFGVAVLAAGYLLWGLKLVKVALHVEIARAKGWFDAMIRNRTVVFVLTGLLVLTASIYPFVVSRQYVNLGFETLIYVTLALGLNVIVGYGGLLVLGYAAFWAIGSYTFAILALRLGVNMWISLPAAGLASMIAGFLLGLPSLRLRGDYLAIVTLGFGEAIYYFLKTDPLKDLPPGRLSWLFAKGFTGGEMGLPNKDIKGDLQLHTSIFDSNPLTEPNHYYWPALLLVILAVFVILRVERSRVGRALVAMREDETAARCMGINTTALKLAAFAFAAMWAGFAGVLWTAKLNYTNPMYFHFMQSAIILAMVVLGGMGSIPGVIVGAILLYAGPALLRQYFPALQTYRLLIFGAIMVVLMIYRPQGLFGSARLKVHLGGGEGSE